MLFPPLGAWLGVGPTGALAATGASAAFGALAGRTAGLWFVPAMLATLASGRITFALGVAFGVAAALAAVRGRAPVAAALGVLTALASPVAALFTGLAGAALVLGAANAPRPVANCGLRDVRRAGVGLALAVAVPTGALALAFPAGGTFPFAVSAFAPAFVAGVAVAVAAPRGGVLQIGGALYALLCVAVFVVPTPVGGNATRLGTLVAAPVAVALLWPHRRVALALLALPIAYWFLQPAVRDVRRAHDDPSTQAAFFAPVLEALPAGPLRIEVPLLESHGEARHLARHVAIARGWERQIDRDRNPLFYSGRLTAARYARWLRENAVALVALPRGVPFDPAGEAERRLVASAPAFLEHVGTRGAWRLYRVRGTRPLAEGAARLTALTPDGFALAGARAGSTLVRVRFTRWWRIASGAGCVERAGRWTRVRTTRPGPVVVRARATGARCRDG